MLLTTKFFDAAEFTILTQLSLLSCCRLSFPIVCLKVSSLPSCALKSPKRIPVLIPKKYCLLNHQVSPHIVHAHSEQYYTSDLSELYMTPDR